jgi:pimeloyl-ACP methyl ester carboxylesterase
VANVLEYEDLSGVVLVGHSYAGGVIAGVAARVPERVGHLVYLDAWVPADGQCWRDTAAPESQAARDAAIERQADGTLPAPTGPAPFGVTDAVDAAWVRAKVTGQPAATWFEPLRLPRPPTTTRTYVLCTNGAPAAVAFAERARTEPGWRYRELPTGHDAMVTMPRELSDLLLDVVHEVEGGQ